jgi:hypothetical protein
MLREKPGQRSVAGVAPYAYSGQGPKSICAALNRAAEDLKFYFNAVRCT